MAFWGARPGGYRQTLPIRYAVTGAARWPQPPKLARGVPNGRDEPRVGERTHGALLGGIELDGFGPTRLPAHGDGEEGHEAVAARVATDRARVAVDLHARHAIRRV